MKKLRVVSDGTTVGTKIYVVNGANEIDISGMIQAVYWGCHAADDAPKITLTVPVGHFDVIGELEKIVTEPE